MNFVITLFIPYLFECLMFDISQFFTEPKMM